MSIKLSKKALRLALSLFGKQTEISIYGCYIADHYPVEGEELIKAGALTEGPINTCVPYRANYEHDFVEAEWHPETKTYRYFFWEEGGGWDTVPEMDLKTFILDKKWLLHYIQSLIGIDSHIKVREFLKDYLWDLGEINVNGYNAPVLLVDSLRNPAISDKLLDAISQWKPQTPGIVLTGVGIQTSRYIQLPFKHKIIEHDEYIKESDDGKVVIDMGAIHSQIEIPVTTHDPSRFPTPLEAKWEDFTFEFIAREVFNARCRGVDTVKRIEPDDLGMRNRKNGRPTLQWTLLHSLAKTSGILSLKSPQELAKIKKQKHLLAKKLKSFFQLNDDPIIWNSYDRHWTAKFLVRPD
ncbi:hypothetical protein ACQZV8_19090 [Magnetococcales bacterium HHB-1]